jgi:hypothetical protein
VISPKNAESLGRRRFGEWLQNYQPDFVLVHNPPWMHESGVVDPVKRQEYRVHGGFEFPGFALLARNGRAAGG